MDSGAKADDTHPRKFIVPFKKSYSAEVSSQNEIQFL